MYIFISPGIEINRRNLVSFFTSHNGCKDIIYKKIFISDVNFYFLSYHDIKHERLISVSSQKHMKHSYFYFDFNHIMKIHSSQFWNSKEVYFRRSKRQSLIFDIWKIEFIEYFKNQDSVIYNNFIEYFFILANLDSIKMPFR